MAVMIARTTATMTYVRTVACPPPPCVSAWAPWLPSPAAACVSAMSALLRDEVDDGEDRHPDDVDEVPVQARDLDLGVVARVEPAPLELPPEAREPDHAAADVGAVEPGEGEEGRAEEIGGQGEPVVERERGELVHLVPHEVRAQERGGEQPAARPREVALLQSGEGQHHGERRGEEHRRALRGEGDVEHVVRAAGCSPPR